MSDTAAILQNGAEQLKLQISNYSINQLIQYLGLLQKWNRVYNLTAVRDAGQMLSLHLLDSLAVIPVFDGIKSWTTVLDVGSGGGLPGLVLAIWMAEHRPDAVIHLVDTVQKKTAFLQQAKSELGLKNVQVHHQRVEDLKLPQPCDLITSRAFAELGDFINWSEHLLADQGCFIAMKGLKTLSELETLPPGYQLAKTVELSVPGLKAERHAIVVQRCL